MTVGEYLSDHGKHSYGLIDEPKNKSTKIL